MDLYWTNYTSWMVSWTAAEEGLWSCSRYGSDPEYAVPVQLNLLPLQAFTLVWDVLVAHITPLRVDGQWTHELASTLLPWFDDPGHRIPRRWRNLETDPLRAVSRSLVRIIEGAVSIQFWVGKWAAPKWTMLFGVFFCGSLMAGLVGWTEMVVAGVERRREPPREELWRQWVAFGVLILHAGLVSLRRWLIPYVQTIRRARKHRKVE